jgi:glutathione S-transferase
MKSILLHDLAALDGRRPSPFCWRAKYALAHKGLAFEASPVSMTDIRKLYGGAHETVPIIEDGERTVCDSWAIADYLDEAYPDRPRIFASPGERGLCRFIEASMFPSVVVHLFYAYVKDIHDVLPEKDRVYFRESREKRLGCALEEAAAGREARIENARAGLESLRVMLGQLGQPFVAGESPGYGDYVVASFLLWIASVATAPLLRADDPLLAWFERVRDLHGGIGRTATVNAIAG